MASAVMRPLTAGDEMQKRWHDGKAMAKVAASFIKPNNRLTAFERLEIYNRQYWFRLRDCFYDDYPGLRAVLGDAPFARLAEAYLTKYPSASYSLRNLGGRLLKFLHAEPKWIAANKALALDMARLEWAQVEAFDNEAKPMMTTDSLLEINPERTLLQLQPHLSLLDLAYPVDEFLVQLKQADRLRDEASNAMASRRGPSTRKLKNKLKAGKIFLAVHRHNDTVYYKRLEQDAFTVLSAFRPKSTVADACQQLGKVEGDPAVLGAKIQEWFRSWAALGWLCRVD